MEDKGDRDSVFSTTSTQIDDTAAETTTDTMSEKKTIEPKPSTITKPRPRRDALHTPIRVPKELAAQLASNKSRAQAKVKAKAPSPLESEEATVSALVQASCRVHEAMELATAACNQVISHWTGIDPETAAEVARTSTEFLDMSGDEYWAYWRIQKQRRDRGEPAMTKKALYLQLALMGTRLQAAVVGAKMGAVFVERERTVQKKLLLPLQVFADDAVGNGKDETAATFESWTGGTTVATDLKDLIRVIEIMLPPMKAVPESFAGSRKYIANPMANLVKQIEVYSSAGPNSAPWADHVVPLRAAFLDWGIKFLSTRTGSGAAISDGDAVATAADKLRCAFEDSYSKIRTDTVQAAQNIKTLIFMAQAMQARVHKSRRRMLKPSRIGRWVRSKRSKPFSAKYQARTRRWEAEEATLSADKILLDTVLESVSQANEAFRIEQERQANSTLQTSL